MLSLLGTITLIGTSTTSLVACNKQNIQLAKKKKKTKKTNNQEIKII
ncbi:Vmc-like lipoprotein signal peptide domain-containing protein [Spiroplasma poulsonii]